MKPSGLSWNITLGLLKHSNGSLSRKEAAQPTAAMYFLRPSPVPLQRWNTHATYLELDLNRRTDSVFSNGIM